MTVRWIQHEVTEHMCNRFKEKHPGVRVFEVYFFDDEQRVFCCELTPSRELWFSGYTFWSDERELDQDEVEAIHGKLDESETEPVTYMWVSDVDRMMAAHPDRTGVYETLTREEFCEDNDYQDLGEGELYGRWMDAVLEDARANGVGT